jgi:maltose O-acetyltransferase
MTMRERIAEGKLFTDDCEGLPEDRLNAKLRMMKYNQSSPADAAGRKMLLDEIFGREVKAWIEPPFYFCYGRNIELGDMTYINCNCSFIDDGKIIIGKNVMFGPGCTIATVGHPVNPEYRYLMYTDTVVIKDNCWIGSGVNICPGVTIGKNCVIGAGSVVTKDIPANSVAVGNPCRVLREINEHDMTCYYKDKLITQEDLEEEKRLHV